ncbi:hypothetical protein C7I55_10550 [Sphingomonas deserti]|uniref:Uncharacterized protein n=2 Tax=Allosphingosinicella deserti TaxID=2116704 RepID=A0A2P7QRX8_9SPHN|nr:hypothetical protein C7I55_10550 [Sphingomonas deserti]
MVSPTETSGSVLPGFPGEEVEVDDSIMPEVDVTWMATRKIGFGLIAATTKHDASMRLRRPIPARPQSASSVRRPRNPRASVVHAAHLSSIVVPRFVTLARTGSHGGVRHE